MIPKDLVLEEVLAAISVFLLPFLMLYMEAAVTP